MSLFIMFIILLVMAAFISIRFKKDISDTIFLSLCIIMLLLFILGVLGLLKYSVILIMLLTIFLLLYDIYSIIIDKKLIKKFLLKPALLYMIIAFIITGIIYSNAYIKVWDEFSHWALYVKNIFNSDKLWDSSFTSVSNGYPPIISIFQYFLMKLNNTYNEAYLYQGLSLVTILPITYFLKNITFKDKGILALIIFLLIFFPFTFSNMYVLTIYIDVVIGVIFASIMISLIIDKITIYSFIKNIFACSLLILSKEFGIILVGIYFFVLLIDIIFIRKEEYLKLYHSVIKKHKIINIILILLPFLSRIIWYIYVKNLNITSQVDITLNTNSSNNIIKMLDSFIRTIFTQNISSGGGIIKMPTFHWLFVFVIILIIARKNINNKTDRRLINLAIITNISSFVLYCGALLVSYYALFSSYESSIFASFTRYITTLLIAIYMITFFVLIYLLITKKLKNYLFPIFMVIMFVFTFGFNVAITQVKGSIINTENKEIFYRDFRSMNFLKDRIDGKTYFISCGSNGFDYWISRYLLTPNQINEDFGSWSIAGKINEDDLWSTEYSVEKWSSILKNYKFVYLHYVNDEFKTKFKELFVDKDIIYSRNLYKVIIDNDKVMLEIVEY